MQSNSRIRSAFADGTRLLNYLLVYSVIVKILKAIENLIVTNNKNTVKYVVIKKPKVHYGAIKAGKKVRHS